MPITDILEEDRRKRLTLLREEAKRRGLVVPEYTKVITFPVDSNGYFVKEDGSKYNPLDADGNYRASSKFVESKAVLSALISGRAGGKALALDTLILTTKGWKTMGMVQIGDYVFGSDGNPYKILNTSEVFYNHKCYKFTFSDGSEIVADEDHLWFTWDRAARKAKGRRVVNKKKNINTFRTFPKVRNTKKILDTVRLGYRNEVNHSIKVCNPLQFSHQELPIDPYLLGIWLGDGSKGSARITIAEQEILDEIQSCGYDIVKESYDKYLYKIFIFGEDSSFRNSLGQFKCNDDSLYGKFRQLNLLNNKHIPDIYKFSSLDQRLSLLQGLMDSDGYIDSKGQANFDNTNKRLSDDALELISGLGIKVTQKEKRAKLYDKDCGKSYRLIFFTTLPICRIKRKLDRIRDKYSPRIYHRYIYDVQEVDSVPTRCIEVDSPDHLFLVTDRFIVTHNTASGTQKALRKVADGESGAIFNPRFEDLKTSTWAEFRQWVPWDTVVPRHRYMGLPEWSPSQPFKVNFLNGAEVMLKGLKDPDSARGPNINWLWYDEAGTDSDGLAWQIALASVRVGKDIQAWITTTPKGRQQWIYKFFVQKDIPKDAIEAFEAYAGEDADFIEMFYMSIYDNKENLNPAFFGSILSAYPENSWLREQEIFGRFVDAGGAFGDRKWFTEREGGVLAQPPSIVTGRARFWDLAASEKKVTGKRLTDPDETVGALGSWQKGGTVIDNNGFELPVIGRFYLEDQVCGHWQWKNIKKVMVETAAKDGPYVPIYIEQEPAAGGKNQIAELVDHIHKELGHHYKVEGKLPREWGDRVMGANTWFAEAAQGLWSVVYGNWTSGFFDQLDTFDGSDLVHDDRITSVTGLRHCLAPTRLWKSMKFLHIGQKFNADD